MTSYSGFTAAIEEMGPEKRNGLAPEKGNVSSGNNSGKTRIGKYEKERGGEKGFKKPWSSLFSNFTPEEGLTLDFFELEESGSERCASFSSAEMAEGSEEWENTLVSIF